MAIDMLLKIDGVDGESTDAKHKNEIAILSFAWGEAQLAPASSAGGGGSSAGKVLMQDFHFSMLVNKASPRLFLACAKAEHFKTAVFTLRRAGVSPADFLKWHFTDVLISAFQTAGDAATGALPTDHLSLGFGKIEVEYTPMKSDGSLGAPVKAGWNVKTNRSV
jgi:type VI secretion system secreted protein Hcp